MNEVVERSCETLQRHSSLMKANMNYCDETVNGYSEVIKANNQVSQFFLLSITNTASEYVIACNRQVTDWDKVVSFAI